MDASAIFDSAAIARLRKLGGDKFAAEMITLFLDYAGKKVAEAQAGQSAGDWKRVADATHPIKSSAGNVGALLVQKLAAEAEHAARTDQTNAAAAQVEALGQAFAAIRPLLEAEREKLLPKPS